MQRVIPLLALVLALASPAPARGRPRAAGGVLITAVHYYGVEGAPDEAIRLTNVTTAPVALDDGWAVLDGQGRRIGLGGLRLDPGEHGWVANTADAFTRQFGFAPRLTFGGSGLGFALPNDGGAVQLVREEAEARDSANAGGGAWDAGIASPAYRTMERRDAGAPDAPDNWASTAGSTGARDRLGTVITGSPGTTNTAAGIPSAGQRDVVINEVAWMGTRAGADDEWIELWNTAAQPVDVTGWRIAIAGKGSIPLTGTLAAGGFFLIQRMPGTFMPPIVADLTVRWQPNLSNAGEVLRLVDARRRVVDAVAYGAVEGVDGWLGPPLRPYVVPRSIPAEGQILARRRGWPDTDAARDWVNDRADAVDGRRVVYPGWEMAGADRFATPAVATDTVTLAIAPDASFEFLSAALATAERAIDIELYTFEHAGLADMLARKAAEGVTVRILLDGSPVGGLADAERWACGRITEAGAPSSGCWFMRGDAAARAPKRYKALHAKFAVIDGRVLIVASENFGPNGYPDDDKADGTLGHRGALAVVRAPALVQRAQQVFGADLDPARADIVRWCAACAPYGAPPFGFTPVYTTGGVSYTVHFTRPFVVAQAGLALETAPDSVLRSDGGLLALLNAAGPGDEILAQQLTEPDYWGPVESNPENDPNARLAAVLGAAARGARVRLMLDGYYAERDAPRGNWATAARVNALARANGWDAQALVADPTRHGIHNKMYLVRVGAGHYAQIGSWNGSEVSAKLDREMTLLIDSAEAHAYLRAVFNRDWWVEQPVLLPLLMRDHAPSAETPRVLVSEVLFNPAGADETGREWVELYNPTRLPMPLAGVKLGDAEAPGKFGDGMYAFPDAAVLPPGGVIVVAQNAALFRADWGRAPDYELADYDAAVPDLLPYTAWSAGTLSLANAGDQVLLLGPADTVIDAAQWLTDTLAGTRPFPAAIPGGHSLQRHPPDRDTDDCVADFRDQAIPSPGRVP